MTVGAPLRQSRSTLMVAVSARSPEPSSACSVRLWRMSASSPITSAVHPGAHFRDSITHMGREIDDTVPLTFSWEDIMPHVTL